MPAVRFLPDLRTVESEPDESILDAALRSGIPHTHACGGKGRCSTCRVVILRGLENCRPRTEEEEKLAALLGFGEIIRLACQTKIGGNVELRRLVLDPDDEELADQRGPDTVPRPVGEEQKVAVLFADIRQFTAFSERLLPYDIIHILNRFFRDVDRAVNRHRGSITSYMGDGFMALFRGEDDPSLRAVRCGLDIMAAVTNFQPYVRQLHKKGFDVSIGIHYGEAVVGAIELGPDRRRITAIGDVVNTASKIEAATRTVGHSFLISEQAYVAAGLEVAADPLPPMALPGKSGEFVLYRVAAAEGDDQ